MSQGSASRFKVAGAVAWVFTIMQDEPQLQVPRE